MMIDMCGACGQASDLDLGNGFICQECMEVAHSGMEEDSFIRSSMMCRKFPLPMSDPWAKV